MPDDIVERLRTYPNSRNPACQEAAAEIERLREEKISAPGNIHTSADDEKLLRATLLQCYGTRATAFHVSKEHYRYLAEQIIALREEAKRNADEIERLRAENDRWRRDFGPTEETERLRADNKLLTEGLLALQAELERLRVAQHPPVSA